MKYAVSYTVQIVLHNQIYIFTQIILIEQANRLACEPFGWFTRSGHTTFAVIKDSNSQN